MEELLRWAENQGAHIRKLQLSGTDNRVFVAADDIEVGDTVISLPQKLLLHAELAYDDQEYGEAFRLLREELGAQVDQRHILCLLLIVERARAASSKWSTYVNILPATYDDPYWWSTQEKQLVAGTRLSKAIEQYKPGLDLLLSSITRLDELCRRRSDDPSVLSSYHGGWALTPDAARWARSTIWSRAFTVHQLCGHSSVVALVPVLDMIDHSPDVEVVWHTGPDGLQDFQFTPLTAVSKGSVISNNYGNKTNDELLLAYGFMLPDNPADYFQVSLACGASDDPPPTQELGPSAGPGNGAGSLGPPGSNGFTGPEAMAPQQGGCLARGSEPDGDEGKGLASGLQQRSEQLQREIAMLALGLERQHRLRAPQPLPPGLLLSAQLGLLPPPELYQLSAKLLQAPPEQAAPQQAPQQAAGLGPLPSDLPSTAMHILPSARRSGSSDAAAASTHADEEAAAKAMLFLGGLGTQAPSSKALAHTLTWQAKKLPALVAVQHQVEAKLGALLSEQQAREALAVPDCAGSRHAGLALAYVAEQRRLLHAALRLLLVQLSDAVLAMAHHVQLQVPAPVPGGKPGGCTAFEVLQPAAADADADAAVAGSPTAMPAAFNADREQHMQSYNRWLARELPQWPADASSMPSSSGRGGRRPGMCEVLCHPRREALAAAASASRAAAAAASASGSRGGRRKPLSSLTLRSLRNISSTNMAAARPGAAGQHCQQQVAAQQQQQSKALEDDFGRPLPQPQPQQSPVPSLPAGIASSLGLDMVLAYDSLAWGAMVVSPHEPGDVVLEVPLEHTVAARSRSQLLEALMIRAHDLLQELVANAASHHRQHGGGAAAEPRAGAGAGELPAADMLVLHLMHVVGAPAASRMPASENERVSMLMEMLEDSPAGSECQEAFEALKGEYQLLSSSIAAGSHANGGGAPRGGNSGAGNSSKVMRKVLTWPGAFGLYCWAVGVVERCAVQVAAHEASAAGPAGQGAGALWLVLPLVSAVPEPLRRAALSVEAAGGHVRVRAACALPAGLLLSPLLTLPFGNVDQLLGTYGPEALAWRRLISYQHQCPPGDKGPIDGSASPSGSSSTAVDTGAYLESLRATGPRVLYELYISPSEEDRLFPQKMELLASAGLGCVHFLSESLETKRLVLSALKICLADEELLMHPLVLQVLELNQALHAFKRKQEQAEAANPGAKAAPELADAAEAMNTGAEGGAGAGVPGNCVQLLRHAQRLLLDMLEALPADHVAAVAAAKQLRSIVYDAHKHTKRRLRQMDTFEEQKQGGGGFWNIGSGSAPAAQTQQQQQQQQQHEGLELLRQGVHLYLEELVLVLGAWAVDLGLECKMDPAFKRSAVEPSCKRLKLRHVSA